MGTDAKAWVKAEQAIGKRSARLPVAFSALNALFGVLQAWCVAHLLASVLHLAPRGLATFVYGGGFMLCTVIRALSQIQVEKRGFEAGAAARRRLRSQLMNALLALGPAGLRGRHSGELANIAVDRVEAIDGLHARWIPANQMILIGPVIVMIAAFMVDWRSGVILLIVGLFVPVAMAVSGIGAGVAAKKQFVAMQRLQIRFLDRMRGISTIILAGRAADEAENLKRAAAELRVRTMQVLRVAFLSSTALDLAAAAALIVVVLRFAPVLHGVAALAPTALFILLLVPEFFAPFRAFSAVYADRLAAETVAEDFATLPQAPASIPAAEIRSVAAQGLTLAFENVGFTWDATHGPVFEDLSFRITTGELLMVTGASGAGKSTIIDMILGFIVPQSGQITINGAALETIVPAARNRMIGWIGQKPMIFAGSIAENIRFARPEAADEDLQEAIKLARLSELIASLPHGLETQLGEGGFGLSGGQAQRVAIARAFLKDAPLLLLDEPTAYLDPAVEGDVLESIKRLAAGRAVLLASHSAAAMSLAKEMGARRLDLDALRHMRLRGVA